MTTVTQDFAKLCHICLKELHQTLWKISIKSYAVDLYLNNSTKNFTTNTSLEVMRNLKHMLFDKTFFFVSFSPTL